MNRLLEPVFLFLTCRVAPVSGLCKVWRGKIPQRSEDDFSPANPFRGLTLLNPKAGGYICCKKEKYERMIKAVSILRKTAFKEGINYMANF